MNFGNCRVIETIILKDPAFVPFDKREIMGGLIGPNELIVFRFSLCFYKVARLSSERIRDTIYQFLRWWKFSPLDHWIFALRRPVSLFPKSSLFLEQLSKNRGGNVRAKISIPSIRSRINCKAKTRPIKIEKFKKIILKDKKSWQEGWCDACNLSQWYRVS